MLPNMIGFKKTEVAGHMAVTGHTRHLRYEREHWATNGIPGYGIRIQKGKDKPFTNTIKK